MQNGSITRSERHRGHDVWEYRWREPGAEGRRKPRRIVIGTINRFADRAGVFRATSALRRDINMLASGAKESQLPFPVGGSLWPGRTCINESLEDPLHQNELPRLPAQVDHSAMGRLHAKPSRMLGRR